MSKHVVIVGAMASGKTALAKYMESKGYERIITYTTRPERQGEVNGIDYHFVSDQFFDLSNSNGLFAESMSYQTASGEWKYASAKADYLKDNDTVIILNPDGVYALNVPATVVWLNPPNEILLRRALERGDDVGELTRRVKADRMDFLRFSDTGKYDLRITDALESEDLLQIIERYIEFADTKGIREYGA